MLLTLASSSSLLSQLTVSLGTALDTINIWSPAITGNVIVIGTDPVYHSYSFSTSDKATTFISNAMKFVVDQSGNAPGVITTGLYACTSCYYNEAPPNTYVPWLAGLGTFTTRQADSCYNIVHKGESSGSLLHRQTLLHATTNQVHPLPVIAGAHIAFHPILSAGTCLP